MTATHPRTRSPLRLACAAGFAALLALAGCKSNKDGSAPANKSRDPLVSGPRIPAQNLPVPDRGGVGVKGTKNDPLLDKPVGRGDKSGVGYSDDPARFKGVYVPGANTTPAALAGKWKDGDELKIDEPEKSDGRVPLKPTGGDVKPAGGFEAGDGIQPLYTELEKYGGSRAERWLGQENGQYVFRASVPISGSGAKRQYTGVGPTATDAVKQVLDQVISDRK